MNTTSLFDMLPALGPLDALASLNPAVVIPLVAIPLPFVFVICIVGMSLLKDYRARKLQQETIRYFVDKGQPVPPELLRTTEMKREGRNDRRTGLILVAVGVSLFFCFSESTSFGIENDLSWTGLIPGFIGIAMLINWALERHSGGSSDNKKDQ
jgi:hypothetical protein